MENELEYVLKQLEKELDYYLSYLVGQHRADTPNMEIILIYIEKIIESYRRGLLLLRQSLSEEKDLVALNRAAKKYSRLVRQFAEAVKDYEIGTFSGEKLQELW